jgi:Xaa-Pro dipeptidase
VAGERATEAINVFRHIRMVKTPDELALLERACRINEDALRAAVNLLRPGTAMREVRTAWRAAMVLQNAAPVEFYAGGFERPWPMGDEGYRLRDGDHLLLDCGGTYAHYWADVGRTGVVGEPSERVLEIHAQLAAIDDHCRPLLRPGVSTAAIKQAAREVAPAALRGGLAALLHPLGLEVYDMPQPYGEVEREDFVLEAGMVVNLECSLYFEFPWGVMQLEDTFVVERDREARRLGSLPRELLRA